MTAAALSLQNVSKSYASFAAVRGINLHVPAGEMLSLIGPSGCGKTTTLRMVAGLEWPDQGQIIAGGRTLTDGSRGLPPERRDLGMVFQSYALWPHMTVADNIAFGLRRRRRPTAAIAAKVSEVLGIVDMQRFAERLPSQLSGGQQQRVALARAIATEPGILLFDEPLSNLDAVLREQMRFEIRALQQRLGITGVYVTHSQDEALAISDTIAVMRDGQIVQSGPPMEIYGAPRTAFVAGFIGLANILTLRDAVPTSTGIVGRMGDGSTLPADAPSPGPTPPRGAEVQVCVRPSDIRLLARPEGADGTHLAGQVRAVSFTGGVVDYFVLLPGGEELRVQSLPPATAVPGSAVTLHIPAGRAVLLEH